jgi:hypothetical protein
MTPISILGYSKLISLNIHTVSAVNRKTDDVTIGINDTLVLQTAISNTKFNGNFTGNLNVTGQAIAQSLVISRHTLIKGSVAIETPIDNNSDVTSCGNVEVTGDL